MESSAQGEVWMLKGVPRRAFPKPRLYARKGVRFADKAEVPVEYATRNGGGEQEDKDSPQIGRCKPEGVPGWMEVSCVYPPEGSAEDVEEDEDRETNGNHRMDECWPARKLHPRRLPPTHCGGRGGRCQVPLRVSR